MMLAIKMPSNGYAQEGRALNCKIENRVPRKWIALVLAGLLLLLVSQVVRAVLDLSRFEIGRSRLLSEPQLSR